MKFTHLFGKFICLFSKTIEISHFHLNLKKKDQKGLKIWLCKIFDKFQVWNQAPKSTDERESQLPYSIAQPYLIFVILFTQAGFSKTKFYTKKTTKGTKNTKNVSEKVKYMHFFTQSGKIYTWQKIFTQTCLWCLWQIWGMGGSGSE